MDIGWIDIGWMDGYGMVQEEKNAQAKDDGRVDDCTGGTNNLEVTCLSDAPFHVN
jgi:hypothetical protein